MIASTIIGRIADVWSDGFLVYSFALGLHYAWLVVLGFLETLRLVRGVPWQETRRRMQSPLTPAISVIVPAYNEELSIVASVHSLLGLNYPEFEVLIVNDGSKDKTLELLIENFDLHKVWRPYVPVIPSKTVREGRRCERRHQSGAPSLDRDHRRRFDARRRFAVARGATLHA